MNATRTNGSNTQTRRLVMLWLIGAIIAAIIPCLAHPLPAFAASTTKTYTIATGNTQVYSNEGLTKKYGTIFDSDEVIVLSSNASIARVTYPIKGGTKTGYIKTSAILTATDGKTYTAKAKVTTYKRPNGASYGYIAKGDSVVILGTKGKYTQVKYPVSGGYKYAFIPTSDANAHIVGTPSPTPSTASKANALASTAEGEIGYQGTTANGKGAGDYTKYGKFTGSNGQKWCASFVSWCVNNSGVSTKVVPKTASTLTMAEGSNSYKKMSDSNFKTLKRGDVIFFSTTNALRKNGEKAVNHVGIVTAVDLNANKVTLVEGNTSKDQVLCRTYTVNPSKGKIANDSRYFCGFISVS